ncbi:MAG: type IV secretion system DNA-binding domain-containing protein [Candidatus Peregrinibacteria bacterium]|nr:type IV secretion system DNA-binding domain-containing protein [Candidatus Peregrinibacteria bacterium]
MKNKVVLQIKVPKDNESGPIVAEQIFATLHAFSKEIVSFEIANIGRSIRFFVTLSGKMVDLVESQIYAQYPDAEIEVVEDYAKNCKNEGNGVMVELKMKNSDVYPIKRYSQFEDRLAKIAVDPIAGITSSLVKLADINDQVWIQIVSTPLPDKWRNIFVKCVKILDNGVFGHIEFLEILYARAFITRKIWPKIVLFPLYFLFWLHGLFVNAKVGKKEQASLEELTSKSHDRESNIDAAIDKVVRPLFDVSIRIFYLPKRKNEEVAKVKLTELVGAFKQFNFPHLNGFEVGNFVYGEEARGLYEKREVVDGMALNNEELATIFHLPNISVKTPTIYCVTSKNLEPPGDLPLADLSGITVLGRTNFRGMAQNFGIKVEDRRRHMYIVGKTGMGKSVLMENMVVSDIVAGRGIGLIDPHGDLIENVLKRIPANRTNDVVLIDPSDKDYAVGFNMFEDGDDSKRAVVCSGIVGIFKKLYAESWGPRLEHILRNTVLALLEAKGMTMLGITRMLSDDDFRKKIVLKIKDPVVKKFWTDEFGKMQERLRIEAISPIMNKVGQFLSTNVIRNIVGQVKSTVDFRFLMDNGKIVLINLSKGKVGEDSAALLGSMFVTKFQIDAMGRADLKEKDRKDFYLYVDEFQNFATDSFATILSEARKYRLNLTIANQYIAQLPDEVKDAVFGNVGSILSFQVGYEDGEYISQQFGEEVLPADLASLSKYSAYMKLLIEGMPSKTFSLSTLPPSGNISDDVCVQKLLRVSKERYAKKVDEVEEKIRKWSLN